MAEVVRDRSTSATGVCVERALSTNIVQVTCDVLQKARCELRWFRRFRSNIVKQAHLRSELSYQIGDASQLADGSTASAGSAVLV